MTTCIRAHNTKYVMSRALQRHAFVRLCAYSVCVCVCVRVNVCMCVFVDAYTCTHTGTQHYTIHAHNRMNGCFTSRPFVRAALPLYRTRCFSPYKPEQGPNIDSENRVQSRPLSFRSHCPFVHPALGLHDSKINSIMY